MFHSHCCSQSSRSMAIVIYPMCILKFQNTALVTMLDCITIKYKLHVCACQSPNHSMSMAILSYTGLSPTCTDQIILISSPIPNHNITYRRGRSILLRQKVQLPYTQGSLTPPHHKHTNSNHLTWHQ